MSAIRWAYGRPLGAAWLLRPAWLWGSATRTISGEAPHVTRTPLFSAMLLDRGYTLCLNDEAAYTYWQTMREALNPRWEQLQREGRKEVRP